MIRDFGCDRVGDFVQVRVGESESGLGCLRIANGVGRQNRSGRIGYGSAGINRCRRAFDEDPKRDEPDDATKDKKPEEMTRLVEVDRGELRLKLGEQGAVSVGDAGNRKSRFT